MSKSSNRFSPEVRERAVWMVGEHRADYGSEWEAMTSIASKFGCTAETAPGQRDPAQGLCVFCDGGARPPRERMMAFIDAHREELGDRADLPRTGDRSLLLS